MNRLHVHLQPAISMYNVHVHMNSVNSVIDIVKTMSIH